WLDAPDETGQEVPCPALTPSDAQITSTQPAESRAGIRRVGRPDTIAPDRRVVCGRRAVDRAIDCRHRDHPPGRHQTPGNLGRRRTGARHSPRSRTAVGAETLTYRRCPPLAGRDCGAMGLGAATTEIVRGAVMPKETLSIARHSGASHTAFAGLRRPKAARGTSAMEGASNSGMTSKNPSDISEVGYPCCPCGYSH